jgi:anti-anti-sigma factor
MPETPVLSHRFVNDDKMILEIQGSLNAPLKDSFRSLSDIVQNNGINHIIFNFSGLSHMDGSGLKLLTVFITLAKNKKCALSAYGVDEALDRLFALTHLDEVIEVFPDETSALGPPGKQKVGG